MNENMKKPEWMELVDSDSPSARVAKVNKKLPIAAVLVSGAVIAAGAFFASASENNASAESPTQTSVAAATTNSPSAPNSISTANSAGTAATTTPGIQDPTQGGVPAPRANRGGDDDGDGRYGDGDGREDHDGEHDGGFERD